MRCRELLAASSTELLKAALVGSSAAGVGGAGSNDAPASPEAMLDALHATLTASLRDAAHHVAPEHQEAWTVSQWDTFQVAYAAVQRLLLELHSSAAAAGCPDGELQASVKHAH